MYLMSDQKRSTKNFMTNHKNVRTLAAALLTIGSLAGGANGANLLLNPSFEDDDASGSPFFIRSTSAPSSWVQIGDGVDIIHNDYTQPTLPVLVDASDGSQFLDLNQAGILGGIYQDVAVSFGETYQLTLDAVRWATNSGGSIQYSLIDPTDSSVIASDTYAVADAWTERVLSGTATSSILRVQIESIVSPQAAPGIDNTSFTLVPEPSSILLLGVSAFGFISRRRRIN